jgi:hypothetical protein
MLSTDPCQTRGSGVKVKGAEGERVYVVHVNEGLFLLPAPAHYANPGNSCVMRGGLELPCVQLHQYLTLPEAAVCVRNWKVNLTGFTYYVDEGR